MVGIKGKSGNRQPSNNARISLTSAFLDALASYPNPKGIPKDFQIALLALKNPNFEKHFVETQGQEVYDELIKRYNRNRVEMAREKNERDKAKLEERMKKDAMREKDLQLQEREIKLREDNSKKRLEGEINEAKGELFLLEREHKQVMESTLGEFNHEYYGKEKEDVLQELLIRIETKKKRIQELKEQ